MTWGIHTIATPKGYSLIVCNSRGDAEMELQAHQTLTENRVAGVLINSVLSGAAPLQRLAAQEIPFVLLNRRVNGLECDYVVVDNWRGSYLAACHLLELGHRHIRASLVRPNTRLQWSGLQVIAKPCRNVAFPSTLNLRYIGKIRSKITRSSSIYAPIAA